MYTCFILFEFLWYVVRRNYLVGLALDESHIFLLIFARDLGICGIVILLIVKSLYPIIIHISIRMCIFVKLFFCKGVLYAVRIHVLFIEDKQRTCFTDCFKAWIRKDCLTFSICFYPPVIPSPCSRQWLVIHYFCGLCCFVLLIRLSTPLGCSSFWR